MRARGRLHRIVFAAAVPVAVAASSSAGCWSDRAPTSTTPAAAAAAAAATPAQPPPRTSGFRFAASSTEHRCADVVAGTFERLSHEVGAGIPSGMLDDMVDATIAGCRETHWAPALLTCLDEATTARDAGNCMSALSPDQESDMKRRFEEVLQRHQTSSSPPPPPSSP